MIEQQSAPRGQEHKWRGGVGGGGTKVLWEFLSLHTKFWQSKKKGRYENMVLGGWCESRFWDAHIILFFWLWLSTTIASSITRTPLATLTHQPQRRVAELWQLGQKPLDEIFYPFIGYWSSLLFSPLVHHRISNCSNAGNEKKRFCIQPASAVLGTIWPFSVTE